jgi:tetratricopeptide (TPR) repeat protein
MTNDDRQIDISAEPAGLKPVEAFALMREDAVRCNLFFSAVIVLTLVFATGTFIRNRVWESSISLWNDIAEKNWRNAAFDPKTGLEIPRLDLGRIYNNVGLALYTKGVELQKARATLALIVRDVQKIESEISRPPEAQAAFDRLTQGLVAQDELVKELSRELIAHTPSRFRPACQQAGVSEGKYVWDAFLPAELCFQTALYHRSTYYKAHLNLGLTNKMRSFTFPRGSQERQACLLKAETSFRLAHTFIPIYEKALWYHASVLELLGEYGEAIDMAERAIECHLPEEGTGALLAEMDILSSAALSIGDLPKARRWAEKAALLSGNDPHFQSRLTEISEKEKKAAER